MSILRKALIVSASAAMAFATSATAIIAEEETSAEKGTDTTTETTTEETVTEETPAETVTEDTAAGETEEETEETRDEEAEKAEFLEDLGEDGYAEVGAYKVELIRDNVYHMDEGTKALPGGATDEAGNMNNPSSIYFVVEENEVLVVDGGNIPANTSIETDARVILEAMVGTKDIKFALTHGHGDHIGLLYDTEVTKNVKDQIKAIYIGKQDNEDRNEDFVYGASTVANYPGKTVEVDDGDTFTVGNYTYDVIGIHAHTAGALAFVQKEKEIVFTGDSIGSGFVWIFWQEGKNPLGTLSTGITALQNVVGAMTSPRILCGHRWQQFWESNAQRPGEMTIQYLNDMAAVLTGLQNGSTLKEDYNAGTAVGLELSANGCKAKIDTTQELIDEYLEGVNSYTAADNIWVFSAADTLSIETVNNVNAAKFMIFADGQVTKEEAQKLVDDLGVTDIIEQSASMAVVISPQGEDYTEDDVAIAMDIMGSKIGPTTNLNLVGIGKGSTFVNKYMAQKDWGVAGIMTYGGEAGDTPAYSVPVYVSNCDDGTAEAYKAANNATSSTAVGTITTSVNPDNRFEVVVENSAEEDVVEAFQNAWTNVLSRFGRIGNIAVEGSSVGTWYWNGNTVEKTYQLFDSVDCINDQFTRDIYTADFDGDGIDSLYYVYVPECVEDAEEGTVPVVFLMHGNTNDPRTQYDTSGWAQIAAKEGIILVCPEWQGHTYQGYTYDPMTSDVNATPDSDFVTCVETVLDDYALIDESRVYISGLSAGCMNTTNNGFSNTGLFAAGAGQSGPFKNGDAAAANLQSLVDAHKDQYDFPIIYFAGDRDEYLTDWDRTTGSGGEQLAKLFAEMNDMELSTGNEEYSKLYGIKWDTYSEDIENEGLCTIIGGTVENAKGVEISMNRICGWGHWNYTPDAQMMWDFMKKYARDPETGETIRLDKQSDDEPAVEPSEDDKKQDDKKQDDKKQEDSKKSSGVNTGDTFNAGILGGMVTACAALAAAAFFLLRKKH